jgi:uncharacterized membrane protein
MTDPLDQPATAARIRVAAQAAGLSPEATRQAMAMAAASPPGAAWTQFLIYALLLLGTGLTLSGVISFFAFNWEVLSRATKFELLEGAIAICALAGWWWLRDTIGRLALSAAAVLVGPLLAVFGQAYQTGADPWGLFAAWAVLIAPWVIVARFTPLWMIEVALWDVALVLFWVQVLEPHSSTELFVFSLLAGIHFIAVAAWEWQWRRPSPWLDARWAPRLLVATAFGFLLVPAIFLAMSLEFEGPGRTFGFFALWAAVAATFVFYRVVRADLFMLTVAGGSVLIMLTIGAGRLIFEVMHLDELGGSMLMAMFIVAEVVVAVGWLWRSVRGGGTGTGAGPAAQAGLEAAE